MFIANLVYDDEELLEPYEWQEDDDYREYFHLPIYNVDEDTLHDFMYGKLCIDDLNDDVFIVGDGKYCLVIEMKDDCIYKRGTLTFDQSHYMNKKIKTLNQTKFEYRILEEAYEKEYGLTRLERMKKIYLEEMIDEIFVVRYELFLDICEELHIREENPSELYLALKRKIEKGYSSFHELLYRELLKKR